MSQDKFDVYIFTLPEKEPTFAEWKTHLRTIPENKRYVLTLGESKSNACKKVIEIQKLKGYANVIPVKYRTPKLSLVEAKVIATEYLNKFNEEHKSNFVLSDEVECRAFYYIFDGLPILEGGSPIFHIEYIDGRLIDFPEIGKFIKLTDCEA